MDEFKLSRDSWWFQLGIPKTLDFSRFFFLEPEKEEEKKEWENMLNEMSQVIRVYDRREAFPQIILLQAMYADFKKMYARFPKENLVKIPSFFEVSDGFIMITK